MDDRIETAWRAALQERGREWVMTQLRARPGGPHDIVYDVVFEAPYPTRAFCAGWCAEQDNRVFRMSWHAYVAIIMLLLFVVCFCQAVGSLNYRELAAARHPNAPLSMGPDRTTVSNAAISNAIPKPYAPPDSGSSLTRSSSPPSLCGYITYDTTRCPPRQQ